jgi:apolipoprotein N-acyltransferase
MNQMMNKFVALPTWVLVLLPALLFFLGWEPVGIWPVLFVSMVPLFMIAERYINLRWKFYLFLYLGILGWNLSTTWWVWYASAWGAVSMLILNTLFMLIPFALWRTASRSNSVNSKLVLWGVFIFSWLLYEYGHHRWDLSWPWLALGNGFSCAIPFVQWYEYTGTLGGTFWILVGNILVFEGFKRGSQNSKLSRIRFALSLLWWVLPIFTSLLIGRLAQRHINEGEKIKVGVLQPSFDPWNEKFVRDPSDMQNEMLRISKQGMAESGDSVDWLLWPETCLVNSIDVDQIESNYQVALLRRYLLQDSLNPKLSLLTGFSGVRYYQTNVKPNRSARKSRYDSSIYLNLYNSALYLNNHETAEVYHKSKLVPGTEQMPFIQTFPILEKLAITLDENSTTGSLGVSDSASALGSPNKVAPIICYESIYGEYVSEYVKNGAQWLGILTNDAWWENTPGYKQHFSYARLRAIETRKWVARSANTGISGFIDPVGQEYQKTDWYEKKCIVQDIYTNKYLTFYSRINDLMVIGLLLISYFIFAGIANSKRL